MPILAPAPDTARFVASGWACQARVLGDGRRQIINILLPGDVIGLSGETPISNASDIVALSPLRTIPMPEVQNEWRDRFREPLFAAMIDVMTAERDFFMVGNIVRLGRQTAHERVANWFVEIHHRLAACGLVKDDALLFPLTQETIADVVGLSVVHVNRTLQQMRREGLIELKCGYLSLLDRHELECVGEFIAPTFATSSPRSPAPSPLPERLHELPGLRH